MFEDNWPNERSFYELVGNNWIASAQHDRPIGCEKQCSSARLKWLWLSGANPLDLPVGRKRRHTMCSMGRSCGSTR